MDIFERFAAYVQSYNTILGLALIGSRSRNQADELSDWDCVVVGANNDIVQEFVNDLTWVDTVGDLFASSQARTAFTQTIRLCFSDFQRLDLIFTTEKALAQIEAWPSIPFHGETQIVFARTTKIEEILSRTYPVPNFQSFPLTKLNELANDFYFKAQLAVFKIVRDDRLIALHLTLDLLRDVAVLAMLIRDEQEQNTHHRTGGWGNQAVDDLPILISYQTEELFAKIEILCQLFDDYARQLHLMYVGKSDILRVIIQKIRG